MDYTGCEACTSNAPGGEAKLRREHSSLFDFGSKDCGQISQMDKNASRCPSAQNPPFQFWLGNDDDALDSIPADTDTNGEGTHQKPNSKCVTEPSWERERRELEASQVRFMRAVQDQKQIDDSVEWLLKQLESLPTKSLSASTADAQDCHFDSDGDSHNGEADVEADPGTDIHCHAPIDLTSTDVEDTGFDLAGAQSQRQAAIAQLSLAGVHVYPLVAEKHLLAQSTPLQCESHRVSGDRPIVEGELPASAETSSTMASVAAETAATWPGKAQEDACISEAQREVLQKYRDFSSEPSDSTLISCDGIKRTQVSAVNDARFGRQMAEERTSSSCLGDFAEQPKMGCQSLENGFREQCDDLRMNHVGSAHLLDSNNRHEELDFSQANAATLSANDATTLPPSSEGVSSSWRRWQLHASPRGEIFYYSLQTGSSQWQMPDELVDVLGEWVEIRDGNGDQYYWNSLAQMSSWHDPRRIGSIFQAARVEDMYFMKLYAFTGASLDVVDEFGRTPLHMACAQGSKQLVSYLLDGKASTDITDSAGSTALHYACRCNDAASVKMLLLARASSDLLDGAGDSPMHLAVGAQGPETVRLLLESKAKLTHRSPSRGLRTATELALALGEPSIVASLVSRENEVQHASRVNDARLSQGMQAQHTPLPRHYTEAVQVTPSRQEQLPQDKSAQLLRPVLVAMRKLARRFVATDATRTSTWERGRGLPVLEKEAASWREVIRLLKQMPSACNLVQRVRFHRSTTGMREPQVFSMEDIGLP